MEKRFVEMQKIQIKNSLNLLLMTKIYLQLKQFSKHTDLRLTKARLRLLGKKYDKWVVDPPVPSAGNLIATIKKNEISYYIDKKKMVLFTEQDAFLAKLAGTQGWLDGKD